MGGVDPDILSGVSFAKTDVSELNTAMNYVSYTCYVIAVILIMIQGIRFIQAAPEGKAKIKEDLSKIVIGSILLVSTGTVIRIVKVVVINAENTTAPQLLSVVLGSAQVICYTVAVILLMWMGVKWLVSSPEGKAEMKKGLIATAIGSALLIGAGTILMAVGAAVS